MGFEVIRRGDTFNVYEGERLFTSCVYEKAYIRPFMGPVYTSTGDSYTRCEPHHEKHPHQRSIFVGVGDVNGVDCWNEEGEGKGKMTLADVLCVHGGDTAEVTVRLVWSNADTGAPLVDEVRSFVFEKREDCMLVDVDLCFTAKYGDVTFGQTKEAGPLGIRVADALRVDDGGVFFNSEGKVNEQCCWGKNAVWCNYIGRLGGRTVGIACIDSPGNRHYPSAWHIRNYGLMAPNNLLFKSGEQIPHGSSLSYRYRICFWENAFDVTQYMF